MFSSQNNLSRNSSSRTAVGYGSSKSSFDLKAIGPHAFRRLGTSLALVLLLLQFSVGNFSLQLKAEIANSSASTETSPQLRHSAGHCFHMLPSHAERLPFSIIEALEDDEENKRRISPLNTNLLANRTAFGDARDLSRAVSFWKRNISPPPPCYILYCSLKVFS